MALFGAFAARSLAFLLEQVAVFFVVAVDVAEEAKLAIADTVDENVKIVELFDASWFVKAGGVAIEGCNFLTNCARL